MCLCVRLVLKDAKRVPYEKRRNRVKKPNEKSRGLCPCVCLRVRLVLKDAKRVPYEKHRDRVTNEFQS